jgi:heme/copper-type cytochrome/quinol oxidase subunit 4
MSSDMVRWGGVAGLAAGLMFLLSGILTLIAPPQMISRSLSYYLIEVVLVVAFALTLVAIVGLHALQRGRYGRLEAAGSLLTFLGYAIVLVSAHLTTLAGG